MNTAYKNSIWLDLFQYQMKILAEIKKMLEERFVPDVDTQLKFRYI